MSKTTLKSDPLDPDNVFSPYKILTFPEVLEAARTGAQMRPINLEINPINFCNQGCTWCTYGYLHDRPEKLPVETILAVLDDAVDLGVRSITWTGGGEPTVYKELMQGLVRAAEHGFSQGINTNGSNLSADMRDLISDRFDYIRFSVDAGSSKVYERTHRVKPEAFDKVIGNIARICERRSAQGTGLVVGFSFLVDRSNVEDLARAAQLAKKIGVDYFQVKPIVNYDESNAQFDEGSPLWQTLDAQLEEVAGLSGDGFEIRVLGHKFDDIRRNDIRHGRTYEVCRGNELLATIGADGSVDLCCAYKGHPNFSFGNVIKTPFREIWYSPERQAILAKIDVKLCPPLCKAHEINKLIHYMTNNTKHRDFV